MPHRSRARRPAGLLAGATLALLVAAPGATAQTIRNTVTPAPPYTLEANGSPTPSVVYGSCVPAGVAQTVRFRLDVTDFSRETPARFEIVPEGITGLTGSITPPTVTIRRNTGQKIEATLTFTVPTLPAPGAFRVKLVPASGERTRQESSVIVRLPACPAVQVAPAPQPAPTVPVAQAPAPAPPPTTPGRGTFQFPAVGTAPTRRDSPTLTVRENTVRVGGPRDLHVRVQRGTRAVPNARIRVTGPGFVVRGRTNRRGQAVIPVTPTRRGTIFVQSDQSPGADRVRVVGGSRQASGRRQASRVGQPRFAG